MCLLLFGGLPTFHNSKVSMNTTSHCTSSQSSDEQEMRRSFRPGRGPFQFWAQGVLVAVVAALALYTLGRFRVSLVWGGVLAIVCWPLLGWLQRKWSPRHADIVLPAIIVLGIALIFGVPTMVIGGIAASQARDAAAWVRDIHEHGLPEPAWLSSVPWGRAQLEHWWQANLADPAGVQQLLHRLHPGQPLRTIDHVGQGVANTLVLFGFTLLVLFFFLKAGPTVVRHMNVVLWRLFGPRGELLRSQVVGAVRGAMAGLVLVGLGEGALITVAYIIAGAPQALLLGVFTALMSMIPMLGGLAVALAVVVILVKGTVGAAVGVGVFGMIVLFLADHFIRPVLIGGSIRLPFVWVLLGILGGLEGWGLLGLFIGPVLMALAHLMWRFGSMSAAGAHALPVEK